MGKASSSAGDAGADTAFDPVPVRARHDGWTPLKQHDFIAALAESGCVAEACAAVRMSAPSAYRLRARPDASTFRQAWDVALDYAIRRLGDAALSRALHGVARPVFYQGQQIGERRHFDEKLTMFLLRYRDPVRYGAWLDSMEARRHPDGAGIVLAHALNSVLDAGHGVAPADPARALAEGPPPFVPPLPADGDDDAADPADAVAPADRIALIARMLAAAGQPAPAPEDRDWRSPLAVRRPRRRSGPDVA